MFPSTELPSPNLRHLAIALIVAGAVLLTACHRDLPRSGPTIADIYGGGTVTTGNDATQAQAAALHQQRAIQNGTADLHGYTRDESTELRQLFPRLPNPVLVAYVFPHLTAAGNPVPGYTTAFTMYDKDSFALPGEAPLTPVEPSRK